MSFKLFDNVEDMTVDLSGVAASNEMMIDPQDNDYIVGFLDDNIKKLREIAVKNKTTDNIKLMKNKEFKSVIKVMSNEMYKRFGLPIRFITNNDFDAALYTVTPYDNDNALSKYNTEVYKYCKELLELKNIRGAKKADDVETDYDEVGLIYNYIKSIEKVNDKFNSDGVGFDFHKARVTGLPKDVAIYISIDWTGFLLIDGFDSKEVVAIILHETGHAFTHLAYTYKNVQTTSVIIDSIKETYIKKDKGVKPTMLAIYDGIGKDVNKIKDKNTIVVGIMTAKALKEVYAHSSDTVQSRKDSEQLADQFAARFGMGTYVISGLSRYPSYDPYKARLTVGIVVGPILFMFLLIISGLFVVSLGIGLLATIVITISGIYGPNLVNSEKDQTYDNDYQRFNRIKNDIVRQLRISNLDKKIVKAKLKDIEYIDSLLKLYTRKQDSTCVKVLRFFNSKFDEAVDIQELSEVTEDLMENNMYVASLKLKNV